MALSTAAPSWLRDSALVSVPMLKQPAPMPITAR
jgi:hypothetical protein